MFQILLVVALVLLVLWVLGLTALHFGAIAWVILVVAVVILAYALFTRRTTGRRRG